MVELNLISTFPASKKTAEICQVMRVKSSVRKIVSRASKMEKLPHICPKKLEAIHQVLFIYGGTQIQVFSMYTEQNNLLPCRSWPIHVSQFHAHTDHSRVHTLFQNRAHRAVRMLCPPSYLPPMPACLPDGKQPRDSLSEHAWWYTEVTKSHSKLLASGASLVFS